MSSRPRARTASPLRAAPTRRPRAVAAGAATATATATRRAARTPRAPRTRAARTPRLHRRPRLSRRRSRPTPTTTAGPAGNRNRQRNKRRGQTGGDEFDTEIGEDDVLIPIAGILDVLDNYAFVRTTGYLPGYERRLRLARPGQEVQPAQGRRRRRRDQAAPRGRAVQPAEVQRAGQGRLGQRPVGRGRRRACRIRQADSAVPAGAPPPRDRPREAHAAHHRPRRADRQGPARPDRRAAEGRQDDRAAADRERDRDEQPRGPPHGRSGR